MGQMEEVVSHRGSSSIVRDFNKKNVTAGMVSGLLGILGLPIIMLQAAANGNYTLTETIFWMSTTYVAGGLFSILIPLYYRMPIVGLNSLAGMTFLAAVTPQYSFQHILGASMAAGVLMLIVGYSGVFKKLVDFVPREIIAAMLAGMILQYMVKFIISLQALVLIGVASLLSFFLSAKTKRVPPLAAPVVIGFILLFFTQPLNYSGFDSSFVLPQIQLPEFSMISLFSISIPLALLILSNDAAVGIGALEQNEYSPPTSRLISLGGILTIVSTFFGGTNANVAGMMTAICADEEAGPKEKRYMGVIITGVIVLLFGIFSWKLVPFIQALPAAFVSILVGFSLLHVFANSLQLSFSNAALKMSAAFTFIIAASGFAIFDISAPVWALLGGTCIARFFEKPRDLHRQNRAV